MITCQHLWFTVDERYRVDVLFLDYKKAFNSVIHWRLIEKLKSFVINRKLLQWRDSFVNSRTMKVGLNGLFSQLVEVLSRVLHGTVLQLLLFLFYVNKLPDLIKCELKMFADDTKVWNRILQTETKYYIREGPTKKELDSVQQERDLHVLITSDVKPSSQCLKSAATARTVFGMVRRTFRNLDIADLWLIYKLYIRLHLEFYIQASSPHFVKRY